MLDSPRSLDATPRPPPSADEDLEGLEIALLLEAVHQRQGYDFRAYAPAAMRRRVRRHLRRLRNGDRG